MPAVLPAALAIGSAFATGTLATVLSVASVVSGLLINSAAQKKAKRKARDAYNAAQVDRILNVVTTTAPRELVLGRVRKGGTFYFQATAGAFKETFYAHLAIAGHEIDAVEKIYLNDKAVSLDENGYVLSSPYAQTRRESKREVISAGGTSVTLPHTPIAGTVKVSGIAPGSVEYEFPSFTVSGNTVTLAEAQVFAVTVNYQTNVTTSYARIWWELGSDDAVADARTRAALPELWTSAHRARGVAKLVAQFTYNETAFPTGMVVISAVVRGAKVYNPATTLTQWTDNPALLIRHVYQHEHFGKATVTADEDARIIAAANACETNHDYVVSGEGTVTQDLYRAALVVPYGTPAWDVIGDLAQAMAGMVAFSAGQLYVKAGVATAPVDTLTDADLATTRTDSDGENEEQDPLSIVPHRERVQKFNVINARIWDQAQAYRQVGLQPYKAAAYITRDNGQLAQEVTMPAVFYAPQAKHIAGVMLRDARDPMTYEAPFNMRAYPLEIFDTVAVTLARYGWVAKNFIIMARVWDPERCVIRLTLKETAAAIYTPDAAFEPEGYSENTSLPAPWEIEPPAISDDTIDSGGSALLLLPGGNYQTRVRVSWPEITNAAINPDGVIEVQWQEVGATTWTTEKVNGDETHAYLVGPVDGAAILIRARCRTELATSDWSLQVQHLVLGKTEAPLPPTAVALTRDLVIFTPSPDLDVKGYRILYNVGDSTEISTATPLHTGLQGGSPWALPVRLYGVNTILVVAVDTVDNESAPATDTRDLGVPDVANVADEKDFVADGYPGTISGGTVTDGVLLADVEASANFWGTGRGTNFWHLDGAADFWGGTQYVALTYTAVYPCPFAGAALLIDTSIAGARSTIEVRVDGGLTGDFWDDTRADFWGSDISSLWGASGDYRPWNGSVYPTELVGYEFRITVDAGSEQGAINVFAARTELPQVDQVFGSVLVNAGGTFVDPAAGIPPRTFIRIEDVQITPIGSTAVSGRVKNYPIDPVLGPEIELLDASAAVVEGPAFVRVSGF